LLEEAGLPITDENTFIAATCKEKGIQFLKGEATVGVRKKSAEEAAEGKPAAPVAQAATSQRPIPEDYTVQVNGTPYQVKLKDEVAIVNGVAYIIDVAEDSSAPASAQLRPVSNAPADTPAPASQPTSAHNVEAPLPGLVLRITSEVGAVVSTGDTILVVESMKMETEVHSPVDGTLVEIPVNQGQQVQAGDILAVIHT
jgi:pyruvate carboxylase subunit B